MTLPELFEALKALGYPVTYSHFVVTDKNPAPAPPFICYLVVDGDTFSADNTVLSESTYVDIELYTKLKSFTIENAIKNMLKNNKLPWSYDEIYIEDEGVFKCTFSIKLIS